MRTRPRAIPLAMVTMRKSLHGLPLISYMGMGLCLAALRAAGAPLLQVVVLRAPVVLRSRNSLFCFNAVLHSVSLRVRTGLENP